MRRRETSQPYLILGLALQLLLLCAVTWKYNLLAAFCRSSGNLAVVSVVLW